MKSFREQLRQGIQKTSNVLGLTTNNDGFYTGHFGTCGNFFLLKESRNSTRKAWKRR